MPQYEYTHGVNLEDLELNEFGDQGWELVAVSASGPKKANEVFWFKREKRRSS